MKRRKLPKSYLQVFGGAIFVFDSSCIPTEATVALIEPMLKKERGIKRMCLYRSLTGIFLRIKHGLPLRALPIELGSWSTIDGFFRRYSEDGTWEEIFRIFVAQSNEVDTSILAMDTFYGKCAREACSLHVKDKDRHIGKSKGGFTTKTIITCDINLMPVDFHSAAGKTSDCTMGYEAVDRLKGVKHKGALLSDKGFDGRRMREKVAAAGFKCYTPYRSKPKHKPRSQENKELKTLVDLIQGIDKTSDILENKAQRTQVLSLVPRIAGKTNEKSYSKNKPAQSPRAYGDPYDPALNEANAAMYGHRNVAERSIGRIKDMKAIAFRRVRCAHMYDSMIAMAIMFLFYLPQ